MNYQFVRDYITGNASISTIIKIADDGTISFIPNDSGNSDWIAYQAWLALGNIPLAMAAIPSPAPGTN